ncbi:thiamine-phosphate kinase [Ichthyobacterium seriolicida]|uniref:Thiamine-monophosphate kinase n=1 Tax=Ichthyobacterium seriolicida TaxID=242600 RepID=A0A1J1E4A3_9FLAO|nr:thiamine-phosphate kinase [Ichthyobacterium seriolicida]BAV94876.1 thiamine-monophosphate kinase [Ichthyobacterium seriolicida]
MFESTDKKSTPLSSLGEFGLIEHISKKVIIRNPSTVKGIGDDAAILDFEDKYTVISSDMLVEGIHFDLSYMPLKHLGYKSVIVNISDIYAMNATPTQIIVSMSLSNRFSLESVEEIFEGINLACEVYRVDLVGGDTTSSTSGLTLSITSVGKVDKADVVERSGAKPNDLIVVSGNLGAAYLGLQILEREKIIFQENPSIQPELEGYEYIIERQLKPEAKRDIFKLLKELNIKPTSMIDISDGLSSEIIHLCRQSNVGCHLFENKIPIDTAVSFTCEELNMNSTTVALNGGEDYELLFTVPMECYDKIKVCDELSIIGHITEEKEMKLLTLSDSIVDLTAQGWNALLKRENK